MAGLQIKMDGLRELLDAMRQLPGEVQEKVLPNAVRAGALVIQKEAQIRAPVLAQADPRRTPGLLRQAIRATRGRRSETEAASFVYIRTLTARAVGLFKRSTGKKSTENPNDPFYWKFIEFGTSKMPARPFLRPAFDTRKEEAAETIKSALRDGIETAANKLGRKLF